MPFLRTPEYYLTRFHPKQETAWLAYKAGFDLVLPWGRRSGKSDLFAEILIEDVETHGKDCLFIAKTQKQARRIIWKKFERRIERNPDWKLNESKLEALHVPSRATIGIMGADARPDDLTGSGYRVIACDEYALWKDPETALRILAPMLGDYSGQFLFGSTKRGKNHFFKLHRRADGMREKYFVSEATIFDNSYIGDEGRAKVLSEYEGGEANPLYRQEILNQYVVFEGQVFALPSETYTEARWDQGTLDWSIHWRGLDHGFSPDPTACLWMAWNDRKGHYQIYNDYRESALLIKTHADVIQKSSPWAIEDSFSDVDPQIIAEYEAVGLTPISYASKANKEARLLSLVNALRLGRLKIAKNCTKLLEEMESYEWGSDKDDHLCFVAGTEIATESGPIAIEDIRPGMQVWTREGLKPVIASGPSGTFPVVQLEFSNGAFLECTPNHPIFTYENGFVRADSLLPGLDTFALFETWPSQSALSLTECATGGIQNPSTKALACILGVRAALCIEKFGSTIRALFRSGTISTIKTEIRSITRFQTSSALTLRHTSYCTAKTLLSHWTETAQRQKSGTRPPKELNSTKRIRSASQISGQSSLPSIANAFNAEQSTKLGRFEKLAQNIAVESAARGTAEGRVLLVRRVSNPDAPVFNLSVSDAPEYFANGILVHNCDALSYVWSSHSIPEHKRTRVEVLDPYPPKERRPEFYSQDFGDDS